MTERRRGSFAEWLRELIRRVWTSETRTFMRAAAPLLVGGVLFVFLIQTAFTNSAWAVTNTILVPREPFRGVALVYCMFIASMVTAMVATLFYLFDLEKMKLRAASLAGYHLVNRAYAVLLTAIGIILLASLLLLVFRANPSGGDACQYAAVRSETIIHDVVAGALFVAFVVADVLTWRGISAGLKKLAESGGPTADVQRLEMELDREFAQHQLWLIDIPVIIGAAISVLIVLFAQKVATWDPIMFKLSGTVTDALASSRMSSNTGIFDCANQPMSLGAFQASVVEIFSAGIAMGFLAAHILMSQVVFIALTLIHASRRRRVNESAQCPPLAADVPSVG